MIALHTTPAHASFLPSSPLEGEDSAARFLYFTKSDLPREVGGTFSPLVPRCSPPTPALPLKGGGRENRGGGVWPQ